MRAATCGRKCIHLCLGILSLVFTIVNAEAQSQLLTVKAGPQRIVLPSGFLNTLHFPDQPLCFLSEKPLAVLVVCDGGTKLLSGADWNHIEYAEYALKSRKDSDFDNGYAGIGGIVRHERAVYALYHAEDHVNKQSDVSIKRSQIAGMFSVGLARSDDGGRTFTPIGQALTSKNPYEVGKECGGVGDVTACIDKTGTYALAYYADFSRGQGKGIQICAARCRLDELHDINGWKKYHRGAFTEPGKGGDETYVLSLDDQKADAWCPHVVYSKAMGRYFLTFAGTFNGETDGVSFFRPKKSGIYMAMSEDGIAWSDPVCVFAGPNLFLQGLSGSQHPTLQLTNQTKSTAKGVLYYAHTEKWPDVAHHLAARTVSIGISADVPTVKGRGSRKGTADGQQELPRPILYVSGDSSEQDVPAAIAYRKREGSVVQGKRGRGVHFDGRQIVELDIALPQGGDSRTLALWVKSDRGAVQQNSHIMTYGPLEAGKPFGIMEAAGKWRIFDLNGGVDSEIAVDDKWHHHAVTYDGDAVRYYIDGTLRQQSIKRLATGGGVLRVGGLGDVSNSFAGTVDEVYVFDEALTELQIKRLARAAK